MPAGDAAGGGPDGLDHHGPPRLHGDDAVDDANLELPDVQTSHDAGSDQTSRGDGAEQTSRNIVGAQAPRGAGESIASSTGPRGDADAQASVTSLEPRGDVGAQAQPPLATPLGFADDHASLQSQVADDCRPGDVSADDGTLVICRNNVAINEDLFELLHDDGSVATELVIDFALHVVRDKYSTKDREPANFQGDVLFHGEEDSDLYSGTTFIIVGPKTSLKFLTATESEVARLWGDLHVRDLGCGTVYFIVNDFITDRMETGFYSEQPPPAQWVLLEYPIDIDEPATCFESAPVRRGVCSRALYNAKLLLGRLDAICRVWCSGEREVHTGECPKHGRDADAALQTVINLENHLANSLPIFLDTSGTTAEKRRVLRQRLTEYDQIRRMRRSLESPGEPSPVDDDPDREIERDADKPSSDHGVGPGTPSAEIGEAFAHDGEPSPRRSVAPTDRRLGKRARQRKWDDDAREMLDDEDPVLAAIRSELAPPEQRGADAQEDTSLTTGSPDDRIMTKKKTKKWAKDESGQWRNPDGRRGTESQVPFTSDPGRRLSPGVSQDAIVGAPSVPPPRPGAFPQSKLTARQETAISQNISRKLVTAGAIALHTVLLDDLGDLINQLESTPRPASGAFHKRHAVVMSTVQLARAVDPAPLESAFRDVTLLPDAGRDLLRTLISRYSLRRVISVARTMPLFQGAPWATFLSAFLRVVEVYGETFQFMSERTNDAGYSSNDNTRVAPAGSAADSGQGCSNPVEGASHSEAAATDAARHRSGSLDQGTSEDGSSASDDKGSGHPTVSVGDAHLPLAEQTSRTPRQIDAGSNEVGPPGSSGLSVSAASGLSPHRTPRPTLQHDDSGRVVVVYASVVVPARKTVLMFVASHDGVLDLPHEMLREHETAHEAARRALANGAGISAEYPLQQIVRFGHALRDADRRDSRPLHKYVWFEPMNRDFDFQSQYVDQQRFLSRQYSTSRFDSPVFIDRESFDIIVNTRQLSVDVLNESGHTIRLDVHARADFADVLRAARYGPLDCLFTSLPKSTEDAVSAAAERASVSANRSQPARSPPRLPGEPEESHAMIDTPRLWPSRNTDLTDRGVNKDVALAFAFHTQRYCHAGAPFRSGLTFVQFAREWMQGADEFTRATFMSNPQRWLVELEAFWESQGVEGDHRRIEDALYNEYVSVLDHFLAEANTALRIHIEYGYSMDYLGVSRHPVRLHLKGGTSSPMWFEVHSGDSQGLGWHVRREQDDDNDDIYVTLFDQVNQPSFGDEVGEPMGSLRRYHIRARRAIESPTLFELVYCRLGDETSRPRHGRLISFLITSEAADDNIESLVHAIEGAVDEIAGHVADTSSEEEDAGGEQGAPIDHHLAPIDPLPTLEVMARRAGMPVPAAGTRFITMPRGGSTAKAYTRPAPDGDHVVSYEPEYVFTAQDAMVVNIPATGRLPVQPGIAVLTDDGWVNVTRDRVTFARQILEDDMDLPLRNVDVSIGGASASPSGAITIQDLPPSIMSDLHFAKWVGLEQCLAQLRINADIEDQIENDAAIAAILSEDQRHALARWAGERSRSSAFSAARQPADVSSKSPREGRGYEPLSDDTPTPSFEVGALGEVCVVCFEPLGGPQRGLLEDIDEDFDENTFVRANCLHATHLRCIKSKLLLGHALSINCPACGIPEPSMPGTVYVLSRADQVLPWRIPDDSKAAIEGAGLEDDITIFGENDVNSNASAELAVRERIDNDFQPEATDEQSIREEAMALAASPSLFLKEALLNGRNPQSSTDILTVVDETPTEGILAGRNREITRERGAALPPVGDYAVHVNASAGERNNIQVRDVSVLRGLPGDTRDGSGWHGTPERTNNKKSPSVFYCAPGGFAGEVSSSRDLASLPVLNPEARQNQRGQCNRCKTCGFLGYWCGTPMVASDGCNHCNRRSHWSSNCPFLIPELLVSNLPIGIEQRQLSGAFYRISRSAEFARDQKGWYNIERVLLSLFMTFVEPEIRFSQFIVIDDFCSDGNIDGKTWAFWTKVYRKPMMAPTVGSDKSFYLPRSNDERRMEKIRSDLRRLVGERFNYYQSRNGHFVWFNVIEVEVTTVDLVAKTSPKTARTFAIKMSPEWALPATAADDGVYGAVGDLSFNVLMACLAEASRCPVTLHPAAVEHARLTYVEQRGRGYNRQQEVDFHHLSLRPNEQDPEHALGRLQGRSGFVSMMRRLFTEIHLGFQWISVRRLLLDNGELFVELRRIWRTCGFNTADLHDFVDNLCIVFDGANGEPRTIAQPNETYRQGLFIGREMDDILRGRVRWQVYPPGLDASEDIRARYPMPLPPFQDDGMFSLGWSQVYRPLIQHTEGDVSTENDRRVLGCFYVPPDNGFDYAFLPSIAGFVIGHYVTAGTSEVIDGRLVHERTLRIIYYVVYMMKTVAKPDGWSPTLTVCHFLEVARDVVWNRLYMRRNPRDEWLKAMSVDFDSGGVSALLSGNWQFPSPAYGTEMYFWDRLFRETSTLNFVKGICYEGQVPTAPSWAKPKPGGVWVLTNNEDLIAARTAERAVVVKGPGWVSRADVNFGGILQLSRPGMHLERDDHPAAAAQCFSATVGCCSQVREMTFRDPTSTTGRMITRRVIFMHGSPSNGIDPLDEYAHHDDIVKAMIEDRERFQAEEATASYVPPHLDVYVSQLLAIHEREPAVVREFVATMRVLDSALRGGRDMPLCTQELGRLVGGESLHEVLPDSIASFALSSVPVQDNTDVASVFSGSVARSTQSERRHFTFHSRNGPVYWNDRPLEAGQRPARDGGIEVVINVPRLRIELAQPAADPPDAAFVLPVSQNTEAGAGRDGDDSRSDVSGSSIISLSSTIVSQLRRGFGNEAAPSEQTTIEVLFSEYRNGQVELVRQDQDSFFWSSRPERARFWMTYAYAERHKLLAEHWREREDAISNSADGVLYDGARGELTGIIQVFLSAWGCWHDRLALEAGVYDDQTSRFTSDFNNVESSLIDAFQIARRDFGVTEVEITYQMTKFATFIDVNQPFAERLVRDVATAFRARHMDFGDLAPELSSVTYVDRDGDNIEFRRDSSGATDCYANDAPLAIGITLLELRNGTIYLTGTGAGTGRPVKVNTTPLSPSDAERVSTLYHGQLSSTKVPPDDLFATEIFGRTTIQPSQRDVPLQDERLFATEGFSEIVPAFTVDPESRMRPCPFKCGYASCLSLDLWIHARACLKREVECRLCRTTVNFSAWSEHLKTCPGISRETPADAEARLRLEQYCEDVRSMIRLGGQPAIQSLLDVFARTMREQVADVSKWWPPSNAQVVDLARMWGRTLERLKAAITRQVLGDNTVTPTTAAYRLEATVSGVAYDPSDQTRDAREYRRRLRLIQARESGDIMRSLQDFILTKRRWASRKRGAKEARVQAMATMGTIQEGDESVEDLDFDPHDHMSIRLSAIQDDGIDLKTKLERARALGRRYVAHILQIVLRENESELAARAAPQLPSVAPTPSRAMNVLGTTDGLRDPADQDPLPAPTLTDVRIALSRLREVDVKHVLIRRMINERACLASLVGRFQSGSRQKTDQLRARQRMEDGIRLLLTTLEGNRTTSRAYWNEITAQGERFILNRVDTLTLLRVVRIHLGLDLKKKKSRKKSSDVSTCAPVATWATKPWQEAVAECLNGPLHHIRFSYPAGVPCPRHHVKTMDFGNVESCLAHHGHYLKFGNHPGGGENCPCCMGRCDICRIPPAGTDLLISTTPQIVDESTGEFADSDEEDPLAFRSGVSGLWGVPGPAVGKREGPPAEVRTVPPAGQPVMEPADAHSRADVGSEAAVSNVRSMPTTEPIDTPEVSEADNVALQEKELSKTSREGASLVPTEPPSGSAAPDILAMKQPMNKPPIWFDEEEIVTIRETPNGVYVDCNRCGATWKHGETTVHGEGCRWSPFKHQLPSFERVGWEYHYQCRCYLPDAFCVCNHQTGHWTGDRWYSTQCPVPKKYWPVCPTIPDEYRTYPRRDDGQATFPLSPDTQAAMADARIAAFPKSGALKDVQVAAMKERHPEAFAPTPSQPKKDVRAKTENPRVPDPPPEAATGIPAPDAGRSDPSDVSTPPPSVVSKEKRSKLSAEEIAKVKADFPLLGSDVHPAEYMPGQRPAIVQGYREILPSDHPAFQLPPPSAEDDDSADDASSPQLAPRPIAVTNRPTFTPRSDVPQNKFERFFAKGGEAPTWPRAVGKPKGGPRGRPDEEPDDSYDANENVGLFKGGKGIGKGPLGSRAVSQNELRDDVPASAGKSLDVDRPPEPVGPPPPLPARGASVWPEDLDENSPWASMVSEASLNTETRTSQLSLSQKDAHIVVRNEDVAHGFGPSQFSVSKNIGSENKPKAVVTPSNSLKKGAGSGTGPRHARESLLSKPASRAPATEMAWPSPSEAAGGGRHGQQTSRVEQSISLEEARVYWISLGGHENSAIEAKDLCRVLTTHNHVIEESTEIGFSKGQQAVTLRSDLFGNEGWIFVVIGEASGYAPRKYLQLLEDASPQPKVRPRERVPVRRDEQPEAEWRPLTDRGLDRGVEALRRKAGNTPRRDAPPDQWREFLRASWMMRTRMRTVHLEHFVYVYTRATPQVMDRICPSSFEIIGNITVFDRHPFAPGLDRMYVATGFGGTTQNVVQMPVEVHPAEKRSMIEYHGRPICYCRNGDERCLSVDLRTAALLGGIWICPQQWRFLSMLRAEGGYLGIDQPTRTRDSTVFSFPPISGIPEGPDLADDFISESDITVNYPM